MSSDKLLKCYRCEKIATTFIPDRSRVLCDVHVATFKEAYSLVTFSSVEIDDSNVEAIKDLLPKEATHVEDLSDVVEQDHRVPVQLIVDHLGELATGVEPATCKVCHKPMQLHAQFATTKQQDNKTRSAAVGEADPNQKEHEAIARPDFLANFADGGRGNCLTCGGTGFHLYTFPRNSKDIFKHLNDDNPTGGHYQQLMNYTNRFKEFNKDVATKNNLPFYVTKLQNLAVNPNFDSQYLSDFGLPRIQGYGEIDFTNEPHRNFHTFLHAISEMDPIWSIGHGHPDVNSLEELYALKDLPEEEANKKMASPFCSTCFGHGQHPLQGHEEFEDFIQEMTAKAAEISRSVKRRRKSEPQATSVIDLSTLRSGDTPQERISHSGPNIKPHDHHNKPHTYQKHQPAPGAPSSSGSGSSGSGSGSSQVRVKRKAPSSGGGGNRRNRGGGGGGRGKGSNPFVLAPRKRTLFEKFPVEKWIYNAMNAAHDMSHTVYENPSYMYRNPNPMYYSVPRAQWGMAKPWRN